MGSIFPRKSRKTDKVISYVVSWYDEDGERHYETVPKDKALAETLLLKRESRVAAIKAGLIDPDAEAKREQQARPIGEHLCDFIASLDNIGAIPRPHRLHREALPPHPGAGADLPARGPHPRAR